MRLPLRAGLRMLRGAARRRRGEEEPRRARRSPASFGPAARNNGEGGAGGRRGERGRRGRGSPPRTPTPSGAAAKAAGSSAAPRRLKVEGGRGGNRYRPGAGGELQLLPLALLLLLLLLYAILRDRGSDEKKKLAGRASRLQLRAASAPPAGQPPGAPPPAAPAGLPPSSQRRAATPSISSAAAEGSREPSPEQLRGFPRFLRAGGERQQPPAPRGCLCRQGSQGRAQPWSRSCAARGILSPCLQPVGCTE